MALSNKSQSALEFTIMLCSVFFFFVLFYTAVQASSATKLTERNSLALKNIVSDVKNEISLAYSASDGYQLLSKP